MTSKTFCCKSGLWILMLPDASSVPLATRSYSWPMTCRGSDVEQRQVLIAGHGEHVVHRLDASLVLVPLEEREVGYPAHAENVGVGETEAVSKVEPQAAQALEDDGVLVRDEEQPVAFCGSERFAQSRLLLLREELRDGALQAIRLHLKVGQAPRPSRGRDRRELVELPARQVPETPTAMPRTEPPDSTAPLKTLNSESAASRETSWSSRPKRMSGLSVPKRSIASA